MFPCSLCLLQLLKLLEKNNLFLPETEFVNQNFFKLFASSSSWGLGVKPFDVTPEMIGN